MNMNTKKNKYKNEYIVTQELNKHSDGEKEIIFLIDRETEELPNDFLEAKKVDLYLHRKIRQDFELLLPNGFFESIAEHPRYKDSPAVSDLDTIDVFLDKDDVVYKKTFYSAFREDPMEFRRNMRSIYEELFGMYFDVNVWKEKDALPF